MQNTLQAALVATGVAKSMSQSEQIWRVVKDDQPCDYTHIAKRTGIKDTNVSSLLGTLEKRGMVHSRGAKGKGPRGTRREYMTDMEEYDILPLPKPGLREKLIERICPVPDLDSLTVMAPVPRLTLDEPRVHSSSAQARVDSLTVAEARELWGILNRMFGSPL